MNYHYVTDKSMFINFEQDHPRLITIETLRRKAEDSGYDSHLIIKQAMDRPMTFAQVSAEIFGKILPQQLVKDFHMKYDLKTKQFTIKTQTQTLTMNEMIEMFGNLGLRLSEVLSALSIAVAKAEKTR